MREILDFNIEKLFGPFRLRIIKEFASPRLGWAKTLKSVGRGGVTFSQSEISIFCVSQSQANVPLPHPKEPLTLLLPTLALRVTTTTMTTTTTATKLESTTTLEMLQIEENPWESFKFQKFKSTLGMFFLNCFFKIVKIFQVFKKEKLRQHQQKRRQLSRSFSRTRFAASKWKSSRSKEKASDKKENII